MAYTKCYYKNLHEIEDVFCLKNTAFIESEMNFLYTYFHNINDTDEIRVDIA